MQDIYFQMNNYPLSTQLKVMMDADYHLTDIEQHYILLVDFLQNLRSRSCCNVCQCMPYDALDVLRTIGEEK